MIDIHCHILAGLDDGAKTLEESIAMVRMATASGTTDIVATPHANPHYPFDPELVDAKISELRRVTGGVVRIHAGCDFHLSAANLEDALAHPTKYAINHRCYVLVEFSDILIPPTSTEIFRRMQMAAMIPVITHPERNQLLQTNLNQIKTWVGEDCLIQVTAQSFLGRFGKRVKNAADGLLEKGLIHFVASDAHNCEDRTPCLNEAYRYVSNKAGSEQAERLFVINPRAVLQGDPLEEFEAERRKKNKWHQFWGQTVGAHF